MNRAFALWDTSMVAAVNAIPLVLVLLGRFSTIDLLIVYAVETGIGLAVLLYRLARGERPKGADLVEWTAKDRRAVRFGFGLLCLGWAIAVLRIIERAEWDLDRFAFAAAAGIGLALYTWYAARQGPRRGIGLGRQIWQMLVLLVGVYAGLTATDEYVALVESGWEPSHFGSGWGFPLATWFAEVVQTVGIDPEAFAAIMIASLMTVNETAATALRHVMAPAIEAEETPRRHGTS